MRGSVIVQRHPPLAGLRASMSVDQASPRGATKPPPLQCREVTRDCARAGRARCRRRGKAGQGARAVRRAGSQKGGCIRGPWSRVSLCFCLHAPGRCIAGPSRPSFSGALPHQARQAGRGAGRRAGGVLGLSHVQLRDAGPTGRSQRGAGSAAEPRDAHGGQWLPVSPNST